MRTPAEKTRTCVHTLCDRRAETSEEEAIATVNSRAQVVHSRPKRLCTSNRSFHELGTCGWHRHYKHGASL